MSFARLLGLLLFCAPPLFAGKTLVYPLHSTGTDPEAYVVELLRQALTKSGGDYQLRASDQAMPQSRAQRSLEHNDGAVQLMWTMTTRERENTLLPIRIPIYKGLIGWRVALVRREDQHWLKSVDSLADLRPMRFGQRADWPDTAILRSNGLQVVTNQSYASLFRMLDAGRFDVFPREVVVAWSEQAEAHKEGLALEVDEHIVLHYPTAFYFFTSRARADLAEAIESGLEKMIADGSFERLFQQHHGEAIRQAGLDKRRIIELQNPDLPDNIPLLREQLWYHPTSSRLGFGAASK